MNIISTNILTNDQYNEIGKIFEGAVFLESDMNEYPEFPCFHLLYESEKLSSFLSVFVPNQYECEIYAFTAKEYRQKGYFKKLYTIASKIIQEYKIEKTLIVTEPQHNPCENALKSINAKYETSDYMLKFDVLHHPVPKGLLSIKFSRKNHTEFFETYLDQEIVGSCKVDNTHGSSTIYDFEITEKWRGKGYGSESLLLILNELMKRGQDNILLHISGNNKIALSMYLKYGFRSIKQIDYWRVI